MANLTVHPRVGPSVANDGDTLRNLLMILGVLKCVVCGCTCVQVYVVTSICMMSYVAHDIIWVFTHIGVHVRAQVCIAPCMHTCTEVVVYAPVQS